MSQKTNKADLRRNKTKSLTEPFNTDRKQKKTSFDFKRTKTQAKTCKKHNLLRGFKITATKFSRNCGTKQNFPRNLSSMNVNIKIAY